MNIQTVIDNLDRTIEGKKNLLGRLDHPVPPALVELVWINIDELNRIREDLITVRDNSLLDIG